MVLHHVFAYTLGVSMKSLFDACRADYVTRVFSPDQKNAIANYSNNVYKVSLLSYTLLHPVIDLTSEIPPPPSKGTIENQNRRQIAGT